MKVRILFQICDKLPKKIVIILIMFLPFATMAQNKNDNTITAIGVGFKQVVNALLDAGFQIQKLDTTYSTIRTEYKKLCSNCEPDYLLDIRVKDSAATITGKWKNTLMASVFLAGSDPVFDIKNERSAVPRKCFEAMNKFALTLSQNVTYTKQ